MEETQASITQWADETFGACTLLRAVDRAFEEMQELHHEALQYPCRSPEAYGRGISNECADILITLYRVASITGFDLHAAANAKMRVNRQRLWGVKGDGTGYHINGVA